MNLCLDVDDIVKQMSETEKKNYFEFIFFREMDSWFSTEFFLCDNCVDDFKEKWRSLEITCHEFLETDSIQLDCFYSGTQLCNIFSYDEFVKYLHIVECPYCSTPLKYNMWPRPLLFDIGEYNEELNKILKLAAFAPFLLLSNSFAMDTLELIKKIAETSSSNLIKIDLYRARISKETDSLFEDSQIGHIPDALVKEGRFNHSGHGHLYVATSDKICLKEIGAYKTESACVAKIKLLKPLKILDLTDYDGMQYDSDLYKTIVSSSLIYNSPSNDSWERPEYVFTRFVADCAIFTDFDAIKYKSRYEFEGFNYVILKNKSKKDFLWDSVYQITSKTMYVPKVH